jgi:hypothetical protein
MFSRCCTPRCVGVSHDSAAATSAAFLANANNRVLPDHVVGLPGHRTGLAIVFFSWVKLVEWELWLKHGQKTTCEGYGD